MKALTLILAVVSSAALLSAQTVSSSIQGVITDPSGAVVGAATCTLTNEATGQATSMTAFADGAFRFTNIPPGVYSLTIESPGFKTQSIKSIAVTAGDAQDLRALRQERPQLAQVELAVIGEGDVPQRRSRHPRG